MGGNAFPNTKPIPSGDIAYIYEFATNLVKNVVGYRNCIMLGSALRMSKPEYNDLDVGIQIEDADWTMFQTGIKDFGFDTKKINQHCFSTAVPNQSPFHYKGELVQLDFMQSRNIRYSTVAYWSPMKSLYKGAHRNILLQAVLNVLNTKEDDWDHTAIRTKEYIDLYDGLVFLVQARENFGNKNKRYETIDRRVLKSSKNNSFTSVVETFLPEIQWHDLDSFETVYHVIFKKYFASGEAAKNEMMNKIMSEARNIIKSCKLEMPNEIKQWVDCD